MQGRPVDDLPGIPILTLLEEDQLEAVLRLQGCKAKHLQTAKCFVLKVTEI